jgi:hypothetical protein
VPAADVYSPLSPGLGNRTNAVSAIGIVLIVYAAAVLASALVERAARGRAHLTNVLPACAAALILVGYVVEVRDDVDVWAVAADREEDVLSRLETARGRPESGTATYAFGYPGYQAPGVPIFATSWDLDGAEKIRWNDSSVRAYPVFTGTTVSCGADRVAPVGAGWRPEHAAAYGRVVFVDLPRERSERIDSAAECRDALSRFRPGPLVG